MVCRDSINRSFFGNGPSLLSSLGRSSSMPPPSMYVTHAIAFDRYRHPISINVVTDFLVLDDIWMSLRWTEADVLNFSKLKFRNDSEADDIGAVSHSLTVSTAISFATHSNSVRPYQSPFSPRQWESVPMPVWYPAPPSAAQMTHSTWISIVSKPRFVGRNVMHRRLLADMPVARQSRCGKGVPIDLLK